MHFGLSDEQQQLRDIARRFLGDVPSVRQRMERDCGHVYDEATWQAMAEEHGWPAMSLPEEVEGWGFGLLELAVVVEEQGRSLTPSPLLPSLLAGQALVGLDGADPLLEQLAQGARGTVSLVESGPGARTEQIRLVLDGDTAAIVLVETPEGLLAWGPGSSLPRAEAHSIDPTRPVARVSVSTAGATRFADFDAAAFGRRARTLLAAEQTGLAQGALDLTVEYAKIRVQYGKPIGTFQAVQHQLADMLVAVECARSATWYAAAALDEGRGDAHEAALTALSTATEAASHCAGQCIHLHGGIGFTWEHDAHLYFKRAAANRHLLGAPSALRHEVADHLLGPVSHTGGGPWS